MSPPSETGENKFWEPGSTRPTATRPTARARSRWTFDECAGRRPAIEAVAARPRRGAGANEGLKPRLSRCVAFAALPGAVRRPPRCCRPRPAVRRPPSAARRSAPLAGLGRLSAPHMAPRRCPARQPPCAGPRHRPRAEHARGLSARRSAMRSQRGRARAPRLETDALNNRDRHRRAQPLPGRAPALAALQSQWAVLPTRHGCARRGIRGTLIQKSYLFFLPEQRYPAVP